MRNVLRAMEQANWQCAKDKHTSNKDELVFLCKAIFDGVVDDQRCDDEQKYEVDEEENRPDPLPVEFKRVEFRATRLRKNVFVTVHLNFIFGLAAVVT